LTAVFSHTRKFLGGAVLLGGLAALGCGGAQTPPAEAAAARGAAPAAADNTPPKPSVPEPTEAETAPFALKPEWTGPCAKADKIDVNLGNTPEAFVRAAGCQIMGHEPIPEAVRQWSAKLVTDKFTRRIDVVRTICMQNGRRCELTYSDPWKEQPELLGAPEKKTPRDIGAIMMFFFNCPAAVNCGMDWANTHAPGMAEKSPAMGFGKETTGFYQPLQPGFWQRELEDAKYAGLSFVLLNTYGPDIEDNKLKPLTQALDAMKDPIKIGLMDDTWTWGEPYFSDFWKQKPDTRDTDKCAKTMYEAKWKPFFKQVDKKHWYRFKGKPFIYFYNAGKIEPRDKSGAVLTKMKALFKADFGEEPFLDVDSAYFEDRTMDKVADAKFQWYTFQLPQKRFRSTMNGATIDHAMVKWDAIGRDHPGVNAHKGDVLVKDAEVLEKVLSDSADADLLVIATWNDLGEGTGFNRNYDYYSGGKWLPPNYFMNIIRKAQGTKPPAK